MGLFFCTVTTSRSALTHSPQLSAIGHTVSILRFPTSLTQRAVSAAGAGDLRTRLEAASERHLSQTRRLAELQAGGQWLAQAYSRAVATLTEGLLRAERRVAQAGAH